MPWNLYPIDNIETYGCEITIKNFFDPYKGKLSDDPWSRDVRLTMDED